MRFVLSVIPPVRHGRGAMMLNGETCFMDEIRNKHLSSTVGDHWEDGICMAGVGIVIHQAYRDSRYLM